MVYFRYYSLVFLFSLSIFVFSFSLAFADTIITDTWIDDTQTWDLSGSPYIFQNSSGGDVTITETGVLNIEAGVVVKAQNSRKFNVYGTLNIFGEEGNEVILTNVLDTVFTTSDRWGGIVFYPGSIGNINFINERHTGKVQFHPGGSGVLNTGGIVEINNSVFSNNTGAFSLEAGTTTIENTIIDQSQSGIYLVDGYLSLISSTISNSIGRAFSAEINGEIYLRDNVFTNNKEQVYLDINVDYDIQGNVIEGGDYSGWQIGGIVAEDKVLGPIDGKPLVSNGIFVEDGAVLSMVPGTIIKMGKSGTFTFVIVRGSKLRAVGEPDNPIIFTSIKDDVGGDTNNDGDASVPGTGNWTGIIFEPGLAGDSVAEFSHVAIRYAGKFFLGSSYGSGSSGIFNFGGNLSLEDSSFSDNSQSDIYQNAGSLNITKTNFSSTNFGIIFEGGEGMISQSKFKTPSNAVDNRSDSTTIDARNNWWGSADGPRLVGGPDTGGAWVYGNVLYDPWLTESPGTEQRIDPVIIIPGITGSAYKNGELVIDPILHTYDDLISTLIANGYVEGVDLFTFPYEWRDSNVLTAAFLRNKISQIKGTCECEKVDIVAHSMGGLVARQYIQSNHYAGDVDQLIFLGTPHKGAPKAYLQWEAGELDPKGLDNLLASLFFEAEALRNGYLTVFSYIKNRPISSIRELLPTFDYIKDGDTGIIREYPNNYPPNSFLENLNNSVSVLLGSGIKITNIVGDSGEDKTINIIRVVQTDHHIFWEHGEPEKFGALIGDNGLERGAGDNTVTSYGATLDSSISNVDSVASHNRIPTVEANRIYKILTGKDSATNIDVGSNVDAKILLLQLLSPVDVLVTAPDGKKIGKNFETGEEYNDIPFAFYSGFNTADEYITILNPLDGEYKIKLQGTDNGGEYALLTSHISEDLISSTEFSAVIGSGQVVDLSLELDSENLDNLEIEILGDPLTNILVDYIELMSQIGWISDDKTTDKLIKWAQSIIRLEKNPSGSGQLERVIDKKLAKMLESELPRFLEKEQITLSAYNFLKTYIGLLINN